MFLITRNAIIKIDTIEKIMFNDNELSYEIVCNTNEYPCLTGTANDMESYQERKDYVLKEIINFTKLNEG